MGTDAAIVLCAFAAIIFAAVFIFWPRNKKHGKGTGYSSGTEHSDGYGRRSGFDDGGDGGGD